MPFFANRTTDGKSVKPSQAEKSDPIVCRDCGDEMVLYDSFETKNEVFVSSHFKHKRGAGGGTGGGGCSGGESDRHEEMKEIALHKLQWEFDLAHSTLEQKVGENIADVYARFEEPEWPYGYGIVVEVQYKNEGKDIEAVTQNYLEHGYSVCWVWEDQYEGRDVDLFGGTVKEVWPDGVPEKSEWRDRHEWTVEPIVVSGPPFPTLPGYSHDPEWVRVAQGPVTTVSAKLPTEWYDEQSLRVWRDTDWPDIFPDTSGYDTDSYIQEVRDSLERPDETEIRLAPDIVADLEFNRLKDDYMADSIEELKRDFWYTAPWRDRFTDDASQYFPTPTPKAPATVHLPTWLTTDGNVLCQVDYWHGSGAFDIRYEDAKNTTPELPAQNYLIPESLIDDVLLGMDIMDQYPDLDEATDRIVRIVDYNTDNTAQSEMAPISSIRQIAHHANMPTDRSHDAIEVAIETGRLKRIGDRVGIPPDQ